MPAIALLIACLLLGREAPPSATPTPSVAPPVGEVVVIEGRRPAPAPSAGAVARAHAMVEAITRTTATDDLIVRRFYPPCIRVIGASAAYAAVLTSRIDAVATLVGLSTRQGRCEPDLLVIFTPDVELFVDKSRLRGWTGEGTGFVAAISGRGPPPPRRIATFKAIGELPSATSGVSSRIKSQVIDFYDRTVLLLRSDTVGAVAPEALGDYLAMLTFTSADETSISPERSIVNLFANNGAADAPVELTAWDKAYLKAYYKAFPELPSSVVFGQVARQMLNEGALGR